MTITVAWERKLPSYSELVLCSDSRLSGGGHIDVCQKIFALPREDSAIGFCGSTLIAYPLINQFISYIQHFKKNQDRALDASELPNKFCQLINHFLSFYMNPADLQSELAETSFVLCYFSWKYRRPFIARIKFEKSANRYVSVRGNFPESVSESLHGRSQFAMIGDYRHKYFEELGRYVDYETCERLDLEPLQALSTMLANPEFTDRGQSNAGKIGGAPQLLKIYPFMRTIEFAIYWPSRASGKLFLNGRETFDYEKIFVPRMNAADFSFEYPLGTIDEPNSTTV
jgi:hypothetical protein